MTFEECCRAVMAAAERGEGGANMPYAAAYAQTGLELDKRIRPQDMARAVQVQAAYVRTNLGQWRGEEARKVKAALDRHMAG